MQHFWLLPLIKMTVTRLHILFGERGRNKDINKEGGERYSNIKKEEENGEQEGRKEGREGEGKKYSSPSSW